MKAQARTITKMMIIALPRFFREPALPAQREPMFQGMATPPDIIGKFTDAASHCIRHSPDPWTFACFPNSRIPATKCLQQESP